jgi:hypothetical protein
MPVLYLALGPHVALGERLRHIDPHDPVQLSALNEFRLTKVRVELSAVLDCCGRVGRRRSCAVSAIPGLSVEDLCARADLAGSLQTRSQQFGEAVCEAGLEGLLVPSCTRFSIGNLVVFMDNLGANAELAIAGSDDPHLIVDR